MDHPNIVPVYDYGLTGEFAYFAMRRIHGRSLAEVVREDLPQNKNIQQVLSWKQIGDIGIQAASALEYAHEQGIIHRDVKPGNMMWDLNGKLWLTDFGLAKLRDEQSAIRNKTAELTMTGELVGTARYMAPERFRGVCTPVSDVYGLGLTLYELATGHRVWEHVEELALTSNKSLPALNEINPDIPESLSRIIMKACTFHPEERYQTIAELRHVLTRFVHGSATADRRAPNKSRSRWFRKDVLFAAGTVALVIGAIGTRWAILNTEKAQRASAQQIVQAVDEKMPDLPDAISSLLNSEDVETREALSRLGKTLFMSDELVPLEMREKHREEFEAVMDQYVEEGAGAFSQTSQQPDQGIWPYIPRLMRELEASSLSEQRKEYGNLILRTLMDLDASFKLKDEHRDQYLVAFEKLTYGTSWSDSPPIFADEELNRFVDEISEIEMNSHLTALKRLMKSETDRD